MRLKCFTLILSAHVTACGDYVKSEELNALNDFKEDFSVEGGFIGTSGFEVEPYWHLPRFAESSYD